MSYSTEDYSVLEMESIEFENVDGTYCAESLGVSFAIPLISMPEDNTLSIKM